MYAAVMLMCFITGIAIGSAIITRLYDVIISEPTIPWIGGIAGLFTREFFEAASAKRNSGEVFCIWVQAYEQSDAANPMSRQEFQDVILYAASMKGYGPTVHGGSFR